MSRFPSAWQGGLDASREQRRTERIEAETGCSAVSRRFSPDMKLRWMPTVDGEVVARAPLPFSGFDTRPEAVAAARQYKEANR